MRHCDAVHYSASRCGIELGGAKLETSPATETEAHCSAVAVMLSKLSGVAEYLPPPVLFAVACSEHVQRRLVPSNIDLRV